MSGATRSLLRRFAPAIPAHLAGRVRVEQVDTLASLGGAIGCVGVLAALVIVASFWNSAPRTYLVAFLTTFVVVYAAGFRRSVLWRRGPRPREMDAARFRARNLHVGVIGVLWATMPLFLAPHADSNQILLVVYVSSGLIASAVVISPTILAAFLIATPVVAGTVVALLVTRGAAGPMLAALVLIYSLLIFTSAIYNHHSFIQRTVGQMELEEKRELVGLLLRDFEQEASDWLWQTDAQGRLEHVSERMVAVTGAGEEELRGCDFLDWIGSHATASDRAGDVLPQLETAFAQQAAFRDLLIPVQVEAGTHWWRLTGKPVFEGNGEFRGYRGVASDVTAAEESQAQIAHLASHDSLTELPNRVLFQEALARAYAAAEQRPFALLWLDLDQFKGVNDTLGHATGDALLQAVADRLRSCVNPGDIVARLGGDEFAILHEGGGPGAAETLAARIVEAVSAPYEILDMRVGIGASLGIARSPQDATTPEDLLKNADLALYRAKSDGRGTWRFYEAEMDARAQERRALQSDLRHALERGELSLMFQPIIDLSTLQVATVETLLRWTHPVRGPVPPDRFIPLAEETGLIVSIGEWVLARACEEAMRWPDSIRLAVNLSPVQFRDASLVAAVETALASSGLAPERLELEITESIFLQADDGVLATLHSLRERGIGFALDDFGTGYSSLSYLRSFPFDKVKIDKSFVRDIATDRGSLAIVRAITGMAESLGMSVVAEGVETEEQLLLVRAQGCSRIQGYLFSRPLGPAAIAAYIEEGCAARITPPKGAEPFNPVASAA